MKNTILSKKGEKGAVSVLVLFTILMMLTILAAIYATVSAKAKSQLKSDARIQELYEEQVNNIDSLYSEQAAKIRPKIQFRDGTEATVLEGVEANLAGHYGKEVTSAFFTSNENDVAQGEDPWTWQLFYDDADYIFLIASNFVPNSKLPAYGNTGYTTGTAGCLIKTNGKNETYNAAFCSSTSYNDYVLASTTTYQSGASTTALTTNPLTSTYLRWVGLNSGSTNVNIKCVAFMLDRDRWSNFAGNMYTDAFAIGGPTIEMLNKSWNEYLDHGATQLGEYNMTLNTDYTTSGYKVWDRANSNWADNGSTDDLGTATNMWCIRESNKAFGYWLASPSSTTINGIRRVNYEGKVISNTVNYVGSSFRPVVVIPKTSL